jgi:oligopeptide transport system ATP-binding protein
MHRNILVKVTDLVKHFPIYQGIFFKKQIGAVHAVDSVSFDIFRGETLGLVGESGCGKTTVGRTLLQLYRPTSGRVEYDGIDLTRLNGEELRSMRKKMQMIFQDPYASLNSRMTVAEIVAEPMLIHKLARAGETGSRVDRLLEMVGLEASYAKRYPHLLSGGQRQRVGIARALSLEPSLIVCDEPISALDVSIQAQVLNLLEDLQREIGLTYLFIAHDLSMVKHLSDRIAVMYLGVIVELANRDALFDNPRHPYTQALLSAVPIPDPLVEKSRRRITLEGEPPSPAAPPDGCRFNTRCSRVEPACRKKRPPLEEIAPDHFVACFRA